MEIGDLYSFVLTLVLIGMILGVGILVLGKFSITTGITDKASQGINDTIDAITPNCINLVTINCYCCCFSNNLNTCN